MKKNETLKLVFGEEDCKGPVYERGPDLVLHDCEHCYRYPCEIWRDGELNEGSTLRN